METTAGLTFRDATDADVDTLVALVESAYRGDDSRAGWTTEADILEGQRTDPEGVPEAPQGRRSPPDHERRTQTEAILLVLRDTRAAPVDVNICTRPDQREIVVLVEEHQGIGWVSEQGLLRQPLGPAGRLEDDPIHC